MGDRLSATVRLSLAGSQTSSSYDSPSDGGPAVRVDSDGGSGKTRGLTCCCCCCGGIVDEDGKVILSSSKGLLASAREERAEVKRRLSVVAFTWSVFRTMLPSRFQVSSVPMPSSKASAAKLPPASGAKTSQAAAAVENVREVAEGGVDVDAVLLLDAIFSLSLAAEAPAH